MSVDLSFFRFETSQRLRAEGHAEDILLILESRGIEIPEAARERITTCTNLETLRAWVIRAVHVETAEDLFADEA
ncbi:hypothetical protein ACFV80_17890 [Streptomyces sp. NPDC059862]|uniref:hypothetical protein n=1 Tax=Streptomyces sp. NPDC059862 TaxID=3346975 RepID=UPI003653517A